MKDIYIKDIFIYSFFFVGITLSCIFYILGTYYFKYGIKNNIKFKYIYITSIIFGLMSYSIKVPLFYYFLKDISILLINAYFLIIVFILTTLYSKFILNEKVFIHTYIILFVIILLLILNSYLNHIYNTPHNKKL